MLKMETTIEKYGSNLVLKQAITEKEIEAALRLRFEVFNLELSEGLQSSYQTGFDVDEYDDYCDHIIVMDAAKDIVVGTYRLLPGYKAENGIGYYSESEFEMFNLRRLSGNKLELGRACVHRDYRGSAVLNLMWAGIAQYIENYDIHYLFGCGSIHTINSNIVSSIYAYFKKNYMAEERFRVYPIKGIPGFNPNAELNKEIISKHIPALLFAYLRLGAKVAGEPAYDEQFGVADFLILLDRGKILDRYKKHYLSCAV